MHGIKGILFDWGNTLMPELPGMTGPMADWEEVYLMPGVARLLPKMAAAYVCAVATGAKDSSEEQIRKAFARVGIERYVTNIFMAREMGLMKFQPEFYQAVATKMGFPAKEILTVGDNYQNDIMPAKAAGMKTALVSTEAGRFPNADIVVPDFGQLALFVECADQRLS